MPPPRARHVVVVGGGVSGLAAAWFLGRQAGPALRVTVLEAAPAVGGKLRLGELAGMPVDVGAEALLLRRPEGGALLDALGLTEQRVPAVTSTATVFSRGRLRPLPAGTVMGIPTDLRALARSGVLGPADLARVPVDSWLPGPTLGDDVAVGPFVARRLGRAVVDRLLEPLLGGVYAGRADVLSLEATLPQVAAQARRHRSLLAAASAARRAAPATEGPVFGSLHGGLGRLPAELVARSGADVRTGATARALRRTPGGWELVVGPARAPELLTADAVVLAVPAAAAARLLADELPAAAAALSGVAYSSMAVVTLALPAGPAQRLPAGSGFLVPPVERLLVKAATFSSAKWGWYGAERPDLAVVRLSVGRLGEEADLQRDDAELVAAARADLATVTGVRAEPVDALVTRWGGALPQYAVGHRARVQRVREAVATVPGLAVCGAAYDGVGIPACVGSAGQAVASVLGQWPHG